jgi:acyl-CoA reductase-like NAD-dependent aldehyde dehydrogenase
MASATAPRFLFEGEDYSGFAGRAKMRLSRIFALAAGRCFNETKMDAQRWRNLCPSDLDRELDEIVAGDAPAAAEAAWAAFEPWSKLPLETRIERLGAVRDALDARKDELARAIALETGKPIREAAGEMAAVVGKFDLTFADARRYLAEEAVTDGPHPAAVRRRPRGPAAVIAPFNFPLHLGHGASCAYLVAGNPVIFKPSPQAGGVAERYRAIVEPLLPRGVFQIVQGGGDVGERLCRHPQVRSICFTGSAAVGRKLAAALAGDLRKDLALELGGKNASIVCRDADLDLAATACADAACLTAGQRCNATSRVIVDAGVYDAFVEKFLASLARYVPGDPLDPQTLLGPLISVTAVRRYEKLGEELRGKWLLPASVVRTIGGKNGCWVRPAVFVPEDPLDNAHHLHEAFAPIVWLFKSNDVDEAIRLHDRSPYGLSASVFTRSRETFEAIARRLEVGNIYANLPTTLSPSTLPFGGLGDSGNRHPGGRGFVRFAADEQAIQIARDSLR